MSKKKKVSPAKPSKKSSGAKTPKKVNKPSVKKTASKKPARPAAKTVKVKKVQKPAAKKSTKPIKKAVKPVKKPIIKSKKISPVKKTVSKKISKPVKPLAKKALKASPVAKVKTSPKVKEVKTSKALEIKAINAAKVEPKLKPVTTEKQLEKAKKAEETLTKKQISEKKSQDVLAITNTIPVKEKSEISLSKIASISQSITNPVKRPDSYAVKVEKEPAGKFEMEFVVHASAGMLYEFLSTPSGLSEWFCDDLNIRNGIYTFIWEDQLSQARLLKTVELQLVRFQWVDKTDGSYFEFRIQRDDLTNDISLIITDFAETVSERESSKLLWHSQIEKLMHVIGSIF